MFDFQHRVNSMSFLKTRSFLYGIYIGLQKLQRPKNNPETINIQMQSKDYTFIILNQNV